MPGDVPTSPTPVENPRPKTPPRTVQVTGLLKTEARRDVAQKTSLAEIILAESFKPEQLHAAWMAFADQRKKFQAEYQLLSQPYALQDNRVVVQLLSPVHETMLNNIKVELTGFLREKLKNSAIQVTGHLQTGDEQKVMYTNREKFDFLAGKNPLLKEMRDRLGLDTDF